eukprot:CAMPEP_0117669474 /NCGR_PEP_ID=MMETSP0804-20121206/12154_1 /TAXON_ID=1074897 /ORGANISM="Tetraselmis astigmatica, Strain CCMP880" /LENGTH=49 /DNA_ID=CAMNT_0005477539 /DNA_START=33 /DNA_END=182 /DNA_ORIENTATION=+
MAGEGPPATSIAAPASRGHGLCIDTARVFVLSAAQRVAVPPSGNSLQRI